jgi:hypothetical protein
MKLHEMPKWKPPQASTPAIVIDVEEVEDATEASDEETAFDDACKILHKVYRMIAFIMECDSVYHMLSSKEQEQLTDTAMEIYSFLQEWDCEPSSHLKLDEEEDENNGHFDYMKACGV